MSKKSDDSSSSVIHLRRSRRQRKPVYDTLNQTCLFNHYAAYLFPPHHREDMSSRRIADTSADLIENRSSRRIEKQREVPLNVSNRHRPDSDEEEILDIYSRVKRRKRRISSLTPDDDPLVYVGATKKSVRSESRDDDDHDDRHEDSNESLTIPDPQPDPDPKREDNEESSSDEDSGEEQLQRRYFLREQKPAPQRFKFELEPHKKRTDVEVKPTKVQYEPREYQSPAHRRVKRPIHRRRHRKKLENASSSSDSDSDSSNDEKNFERRKSKNLDRSRNRFMPVNMSPRSTDIIGKSHTVSNKISADLDPMSVDTSITFQNIGGLTNHIQALKEMILFPLIYPEIFEKFKITPPRGVIFYGAPGTGKTLVARALANECSKADRKVAFFMRKGADCLSKWVGESERQLRLLFDQAYTMRPSIIFFDEIDGLAPVRSSRQDQIHSSIVSTLLALMDGLDQRGEITVIGATNRLDAIDPALRRPGRFDRELLFTLPDVHARAQILKIHTADWSPPMTNDVIDKLAQKLVGYCGADIKGLCTEAALIALRRRYPQIYCSDKKLLLGAGSITVSPADFDVAMHHVTPSSRRIMGNISKQLPRHLVPLLSSTFDSILDRVYDEFKSTNRNSSGSSSSSTNSSNSNSQSSQYENVLNIFKQKKLTFGQKLLLCGDGDEHGQTNCLAPALFHALDHLPIFSLCLSQIFSATYRSPEEAVSEILSTAIKFCPCVVYIPSIDVLMRIISQGAWYTLTSVLQSWLNTVSLLLICTASETYRDLDEEIRCLFDEETVVYVSSPLADMRRQFFCSFFHEEALKAPEIKQEIVYEQLETAPPPPPKPLTEHEVKKFRKMERQMMRQLRLFLRDVLARLIRDRRFVIFCKPVDPEQVPDYTEVIAQPLDLSMMMSKIDQHKYASVEQFLADIDLITNNALEYNPDRDQTDKLIRHRACTLRDVANQVIDEELDSDFECRLNEVREIGKKRGVEACPEMPPAFIYVAPRLGIKNLSINISPLPTNMGSTNNIANDIVVTNSEENGRKPHENGQNNADSKTAAYKKKSTNGNGFGKKVGAATVARKCKAQGRQMRLDSEESSSSRDCGDESHEENSLPSCSSQGISGASKVSYDESELARLLEFAVTRTDGWSVTRLEKLYFAMIRLANKFQHLWNRDGLLNELENLIRTFN